MQRIKNLFLAFVATFSFAVVPVLAPATVSAATIGSKIIEGCKDVAGEECKEGTGNGLKDVITKVVDLLSYFIGAIAVFMVIFGGFKYLTSGGDSGKVGEAKNTILYAMLGLAVVIFARAIVAFVITQTGAK
jgi:hypothetical protein